MFSFKIKIKNQKGAIDKIIVTLIFVLIGIGALIGLSIWEQTQINIMEDDSNITIQNILNE